MNINNGPITDWVPTRYAEPKVAPPVRNSPKDKVAPKEFKLETAPEIKNAIAAEPDIRPEVLQKAKYITVDPNYPPAGHLAELAKMFLEEDSK